MLADEYGTASNIKSRVNRLSVLSAITSTQQRLKLYNKVPPNGLVLYCGTIMTDEGKERKVNIDFEPFKPINTSLYLCDNKFHTEALNELLESDDKFGFIVMDGSGALFGTLAGNSREVLHKFNVDLPKKHGRGGQSALRFARLRLEKRHNYVRKCAETAVQLFISNEKVTKPNSLQKRSNQTTMPKKTFICFVENQFWTRKIPIFTLYFSLFALHEHQFTDTTLKN